MNYEQVSIILREFLESLEEQGWIVVNHQGEKFPSDGRIFDFMTGMLISQINWKLEEEN